MAEMKEMQIKLTGLEEVQNFTAAAQATNGDILVRRGKYIVDGKSFLGMLSLNCYQGVTVEYPAGAGGFEKTISQWEI